MYSFITFAAAAFFFHFSAFSQKPAESFCKLSCPEKRWVIAHPFKAKRAMLISYEASEVAKSMKKDPRLDANENGGRADAFRHGYWMARLTQEIGWRSAYRLGIAHEKANFRQFKKSVNEDGVLPDEASGCMDFLTNDAGNEAGKRNPDASAEQLTEIIIGMITEGKLYVISRDSTGNYIDCKGGIINMNDYKGKWKNPKCVVPSAGAGGGLKNPSQPYDELLWLGGAGRRFGLRATPSPF